MRIAGHNALAILVGAIAIYALGFVIYGVLFSAQWMAMAGYTEDSFKGQEWRMALSPIMPILIAIGTAIVVKWRGAATWTSGAGVGLVLGLFFMVAARMYGFAYGIEPAGLFALDGVHLALNPVIAGAILGAWK